MGTGCRVSVKVAPGAVTTPRGQGEVQDRAFLAPLPGALLATPRLGLLESPIGLDPYLSRTVDGILLHLLGHVRILNHGLALCHLCCSSFLTGGSNKSLSFLSGHCGAPPLSLFFPLRVLSL